MKSRLEFEVETLLTLLQAGVDALDDVDTHVGLTAYGAGYRHAKKEVVSRLKRILKEVNE